MRCAFGRQLPVDDTWQGECHCRGCFAFAEQLREQFERDVFFGVRDRDGYTPAERRRKARASA